MEVIEVAGKLLGLAVADVGDSASEEEDTRWSRVGSGASYEVGVSDDESVGGKRKRMSAEDRKARNRERNRLHARKTRQRKKQHVQELQLKIWGLRQERQRLLQLSAEHRTAGVLLALSCSPQRCVQRLGGDANASRSPSSATRPTPSGRDWNRELALHEETLRKITQEFESMDGGQQVVDDACNGAKEEVNSSWAGAAGGKSARGGKGTLADRTALRRERNRMHAKRTRNRKKLFVEACSVMIDKMKVENAKLEDELRSLGIRLPAESWTSTGQEMVPEEPLPEYLAALWEFAEGNKGHSRKTRAAQASPRQARQTPAPSSSMTSGSTAAPTSAKSTSPSPEPTAPGQAVEDAEKLYAFMEAAQTRSAKRTRVSNDGVVPLWSDHGSTTSESRVSLESDEEGAGEREAADAALLLASGRAAGSSERSTYPAMWTSRQVHERYALPREVY